MRDERFSRSPFISFEVEEVVTVGVFGDEANDGSITVEVNGDGCSAEAFDDEDEDAWTEAVAGGGRGSSSAFGTRVEPS